MACANARAGVRNSEEEKKDPTQVSNPITNYHTCVVTDGVPPSDTNIGWGGSSVDCCEVGKWMSGSGSIFCGVGQNLGRNWLILSHPSPPLLSGFECPTNIAGVNLVMHCSKVFFSLL